MKIESVRIENFRSFKDETITFDNYNCMVGANGSGKSTVLNALNVFFRNHKDSHTDLNKLSDRDFHHKNIEKEIRITVTFNGLTPEAEKTLSAYVRQKKLIVTASAKFDAVLQRAEVKQYGNRLGISDFRSWFEANKSGEKVNDLKAIYDQYRKSYSGLPDAKTKQAMENALNEFEENHPEQCELIPSEDQFYGVTKGSNKLAPYLQWVFVSASKDATLEAEESKNSALGLLLDRAIRSRVNFSERVKELREKLKTDYQLMLDAEQSLLLELSESIEQRLKVWANPSATAKIEWKQDAEKTIKVEEPLAHILIGEKGFNGELGRFGHGMQRSFLLSLLQELATTGSEGPTLIMGIEEPELYQHPPQAQYLSEVIQELSENNCQILVCSHSPYFIPGENFSSVRIVKEIGDPCESKVASVSYEELSTKLNSLGGRAIKSSGVVAKFYPVLRPELNEIFFCKKLILVEGIEDIAHIITYIELTGKKDKFRSQGWHIVPVHGKSELLRPACLAQLLHIPLYIVFDGDTDKEDLTYISSLQADESEDAKIKLKKINDEILQHKKENKALLNLLGEGEEMHWPEENKHLKNITIWKTNITDTVESELGENLTPYRNQSSAHYGNVAGLQKNPLAVARMLELAWNDNFRSKALIDLIENIERCYVDR